MMRFTSYACALVASSLSFSSSISKKRSSSLLMARLGRVWHSLSTEGPTNRAKLSRRVIVAILAFVCTWTFGPSSVQAETETWQISSSYPYLVQIEFYSKDRNVAWPGRGRAFMLDDSKTHTFSLDCRPGERICYGAWEVATGNRTGSRYWGVGQNERHGCSDCCWTCGRKGNPRTINLVR